MPSLASVDDVEALTGPIADRLRIETLLNLVSARFCREARQEFTPGESTTRLQVVDRVVTLPQSPVVAVTAVTGDDGTAYAWTVPAPTGREIVIECGGEMMLRPGLIIESPGSAARRPSHVLVTYSHGGDVPDPVRLCVADAVRRALSIDEAAAAGATSVTESDTRGPFSRSRTRQFASWAVGGQALLSPDDVALARSYRVRAPRLWVMRP